MHLSSLILTSALELGFLYFQLSEIYPTGKRPQFLYGDYLLSIFGSHHLGPFSVFSNPPGVEPGLFQVVFFTCGPELKFHPELIPGLFLKVLEEAFSSPL